MAVYFDCVVPKFCPECGEKFHIAENKYNREDFLNKNSFSCECGIQFISVEESDLPKESAKEIEHYRNKR